MSARVRVRARVRARLALALVPSLFACKPNPNDALKDLPPPPVDGRVLESPELLPPPPGPVIYGHVRVASPQTTLADLRSVLPLVRSAAFDEGMLRALLRLQLGSRNAIADHIDFARPMGCVVATPKRSKFPVACAVGYTGGLDAVVRDMGSTGLVVQAADHAHYRLGETELFFAAMGDHVAVALAPELIAGTREQLQRDIIDAPPGDGDVVVVVHPAAIFEDARPEIEGFLAKMAADQAKATPGANAGMGEIQRKQLLGYADYDAIVLWADLAAGKVELGHRGIASPGTQVDRFYRATSTPSVQPELIASLPAETLALWSLRLSRESFTEDPAMQTFFEMAASVQADPAKYTAELRASMMRWLDFITGDAVMALVDDRGSRGALVMAYRVQPGVDAVPFVRELLLRMPNTEMAKQYEFAVREGAFRDGKLQGDLYTMRPRPELRRDPAYAWLAKLGPDPVLHSAYVQRGDVLYVAMTLGKGADRALRRTLSTKATDGVAKRAELAGLLEAHRSDTMMMLADAGAITKWLVRIGAVGSPPVAIPPGMDGVQIGARSKAPGQRDWTMSFSAALVRAAIDAATK